MQLQTRLFGTIDIDTKDIIHIPSGIPGFEDVKRFILLGKQEVEASLFWLQGIDDTNLAFVVTDPFSIHPGYFVDVDDEEIEELYIKDSNCVLTLSIVTIPADIEKMTVNLKAPLLINMENNKGKQIIMKSEIFPVKYYIMDRNRSCGSC